MTRFCLDGVHAMASLMTGAHVYVRIVHRYFIWFILLSYVSAAVFPQLGLWIRNYHLGRIDILWTNIDFFLPPIMLSLLLFNAGLGIRISELKQLWYKPVILAGGVFGNLVTPLLFILTISFAMKLWHNPVEVQQILVGLALVASMPIAGASTAWAQNADGDLALSLGLVLVTTALSPVLTPVVLHMVGFVTTGDYSEDLHELASEGVATFLGTWVILPSLLGLVVHGILGERWTSLAMPYVKLVNFGILILLNYSNASLTLPGVVSEPDLDFLAVMLAIVAALCIAAFASGFLVARTCRVDHKETVSLMFGLGMNNNGAGLVLASLALVDHPEVMLPIISYNLIQHLVASLVDFSIFRRQPA